MMVIFVLRLISYNYFLVDLLNCFFLKVVLKGLDCIHRIHQDHLIHLLFSKAKHHRIQIVSLKIMLLMANYFGFHLFLFDLLISLITIALSYFIHYRFQWNRHCRQEHFSISFVQLLRNQLFIFIYWNHRNMFRPFR